MHQNRIITQIVPDEYAEQRLDQVLAALCPEFSRSQLQKWIKAGSVRVDDKILKAKDKLHGGENITVVAEYTVRTEYEAEPLQLDIVHEDDALLVIHKPANLVVHPAAGNWSGTLLNGLLHYCPALAQLPRAGVVHRLDKDTSGLMVVAKTLHAHADLVAQLQDHSVQREYLALVHRPIIAGGTIDEPIARHAIDRKKMAIMAGGKRAVTHYRVAERFQHHTLLRIALETGRTHQIRVHLSAKQMPIVGDAVYGGRPRIPAGIRLALREALLHFPRQALHATQLGLVHPDTGEECLWEIPLANDIEVLLSLLRAAKEHC